MYNAKNTYTIFLRYFIIIIFFFNSKKSLTRVSHRLVFLCEV